MRIPASIDLVFSGPNVAWGRHCGQSRESALRGLSHPRPRTDPTAPALPSPTRPTEALTSADRRLLGLSVEPPPRGKLSREASAPRVPAPLVATTRPSGPSGSCPSPLLRISALGLLGSVVPRGPPARDLLGKPGSGGQRLSSCAWPRTSEFLRRAEVLRNGEQEGRTPGVRASAADSSRTPVPRVTTSSRRAPPALLFSASHASSLRALASKWRGQGEPARRVWGARVCPRTRGSIPGSRPRPSVAYP